MKENILRRENYIAFHVHFYVQIMHTFFFYHPNLMYSSVVTLLKFDPFTSKKYTKMTSRSFLHLFKDKT